MTPRSVCPSVLQHTGLQASTFQLIAFNRPDGPKVTFKKLSKNGLSRARQSSVRLPVGIHEPAGSPPSELNESGARSKKSVELSYPIKPQ